MLPLQGKSRRFDPGQLHQKGKMMLDITCEDFVQVRVSNDGKVLWVNTPEGCVLRISKIACLDIEDNRPGETDQVEPGRIE